MVLVGLSAIQVPLPAQTSCGDISDCEATSGETPLVSEETSFSSAPAALQELPADIQTSVSLL